MGNSNESVLLYLLHQTNLAFHEAGHIIFGIFGRVISILGGSLGQLMILLLVSGHFWYQRDAAGFAFGSFWFFENFLDVAHYMADARALILPLIGGLGPEAHDWRNLFMEWGVLRHDTQIASWVNTLGWIGMLWTWLWLIRRWISDRKKT